MCSNGLRLFAPIAIAPIAIFAPVVPEACNFIKKETLTQVFSREFCEISNITFYTEHLRTTASRVFKCIY